MVAGGAAAAFCARGMQKCTHSYVVKGLFDMRVVSVGQMKQIEENSDRMRVSYEQMMRNAAASAMVAICSEMAVEGRRY